MRTHLVTVNTRQHKHINYENIARFVEFHNMQLHRVILLHRQAQCTSVECINNRQAVSLQNSDGIPFQCHFIINNSISAQPIRSMLATQARGLNFKQIHNSRMRRVHRSAPMSIVLIVCKQKLIGSALMSYVNIIAFNHEVRLESFSFRVICSDCNEILGAKYFVNKRGWEIKGLYNVLF